ncbi:MAG: SMC-Scp complex subunit ScpB [Candidatus Zambryskibacteria bacterium]|nr:SMC-Scp complex subunit ScpB [Candidatus Zambryskibacteria bacterium]
MNNESRIEAILFFKNEPVSVAELSKWLGEKPDAVREALINLQNFYKDRGIVIVSDSQFVSIGTHPGASELIENLKKEEFSRELGRAGLETLAIILYKGPVSRREIDYIRGVNSGFILRTLLIRGLIERTESISGERSYSYKITLKLLEHLGITRLEDLPEYQNAFKRIEEFNKTSSMEQNE